MGESLLEEFLITELFAFLLIFVRIAAGIMVLPGIGEAYVPMRMRLHIAMGISLLLVPVFGDMMPTVPTNVFGLFVLILAEFIIGLFIGYLSRILISVMHMAGTFISYQSSLAVASIFDLSSGGQSTVIGNFLSIAAVVMFFTMDLHHVMIMGLADSYTLFPPGEFPMVGDMSQHYLELFDKCFEMAIKLSAPHIIFALLFYLASGVLARLMPQMQVFFILMPIQILIAFFLLGSIMTSIMMYYSEFVEETLRAFLDHQLPGEL